MSTKRKFWTGMGILALTLVLYLVAGTAIIGLLVVGLLSGLAFLFVALASLPMHIYPQPLRNNSVPYDQSQTALPGTPRLPPARRPRGQRTSIAPSVHSLSQRAKPQLRTKLHQSHSAASVPRIPLKPKQAFPKEGSILGKEKNTGELVRVSQTERQRGMYVIGKNGTGKTTLLVNLILQDIQEGMGLCFIDTHGDAITDILRRLPANRSEDDVILLDLLDTEYPFGLNLFQCRDSANEEEVSRITSTVMDVFAKLFTENGDLVKEAPNMARTLQFSLPVLLAHTNPRMTMAEIPLLLMDETARKNLLTPVSNPMVRTFWTSYDRWRHERQEELVSSTLSRVGNFLTDSLILRIVGQSETTIDFRKIMDEGKILLVKLSRTHPLITSLVGSVIVGQIANAAYSREDTPQELRRQFNLYADEYQRFSTPTFAELLAEVRKYNIATCVAHQFRDQLDHANRGATLNARNLIVYAVSGKDAEDLAKEFDATPPPPDIIGQRPILTPKREVIEHLLKNGHSNPAYLQGSKLLAALLEAAGMKVDRPPFRQIANFDKHLPENLIVLFQQHRAGKQYQQIMQAQTDLKATLKNLNTFFYEVMRDRNPNKPLDREDVITILRVADVYDVLAGVLKYDPDVLALLCSPERSHMQQGIRTMQRAIEEQAKKRPQGELLIKIITTLRELTSILARDPIMVDSGQHEPIIDKPRAYADVQNQIATDVANLLPYHAKAKLGQTEVILRTLPLAPGVNDQDLQARKDRIQQATRMGYGKSRRAVEDEITARQAALMAQVDKKRQTKEEEEI